MRCHLFIIPLSPPTSPPSLLSSTHCNTFLSFLCCPWFVFLIFIFIYIFTQPSVFSFSFFYITVLHYLSVRHPRKLNLENKAATPWVRLSTLLLWILPVMSDWYQIHTWWELFIPPGSVGFKRSTHACQQKKNIANVSLSLWWLVLNMESQESLFICSSPAGCVCWKQHRWEAAEVLKKICRISFRLKKSWVCFFFFFFSRLRLWS